MRAEKITTGPRNPNFLEEKSEYPPLVTSARGLTWSRRLRAVPGSSGRSGRNADAAEVTTSGRVIILIILTWKGVKISYRRLLLGLK